MDYKPREIEKKWQKIWEEAKIFEANPNKNVEKKFITSPYPYASGPSHIGHGRSYVNGDIFARYYRAKGYNVLYPMAFHITGTPVLAISSSIEREEESMITRMKEYVELHTQDDKTVDEIVKSFKEPWNIVKYFSNVIKCDMKAIGMSLDWRREFTSGDPIYNKLIEWQFQKFKEKGYIEKGEYPILFCPRCNNAVGEDDIASGDELDLGINEFILIKFPFDDGYLVASTLRPETIYGVTNIWVNPNSTYVYAQVNGEKWIISEHAVELLNNQNKNVNILEKLKGSELIGRMVKTLNGGREIFILPGKFVDANIATGVVYSVPAHAPYDYIALIELQHNEQIIETFRLNKTQIINIKPIKIINMEGFTDFPAKIYCERYGVKTQLDKEELDKATSENYKDEYYNGILNSYCGKYEGLSVIEAVTQVVKDLIDHDDADKLFLPITKDLHCRCGERIEVSILKDQWFLNFNASNWKELAFKCLDNMTIEPKKYRQNFINSFHWLEKRPCARKRGLGTTLPFDKDWIVESLSDSTIYMSFYTVAHLLKSNNIQPEQLIPEIFDLIFLNHGDSKIISKKTKIGEQLLKAMVAEFHYWYPVDHRHTAIMHISNHLSFYIFHHVAIFPEKLWPKTITLIEPLIIEGQKMGKSKGNVISIAEINKKYSADLFRFYISHGADLGIYMDFRENQIRSVEKHITQFYTFMVRNLEKLNTLEFGSENLQSNYSKVVLSKIVRLFSESEKQLENFNLRKYLQTSFYEIFNLIQDYKKFSESDKEFFILFKLIAQDWLKLLSPTIPHLTEELWNIAGNNNYISTSIWSDWHQEYINEQLEIEFDYISQVIEDIQNILKIVRSKDFDSIFLYTAPNWKKVVREIILSKQGDFDTTLKVLKNNQEMIKNKELIPFVKNQIRSGNYNTKIPQNEEIQLLLDYKNYIEKKVGFSIIINSEFDPKNKAAKAIPFKPAIFIDV
ncbi:MAG: leucine--tRNA ligase [Candidatus Lokiarchaeota archaeon]|nr:leucine--tRNA ligase [Candidatus Lokiarchaeota archaeon]